MKNETILTANKLIRTIQEIDTILDKLTVDSKQSQHISEFTIVKRSRNSDNRNFTISYDSNEKLASQTWLSPESMVILDYTVTQFYKSVVALYRSEKEKLTDEFNNLKD